MKGLQSSKTGVKMFEYFKNKIFPRGVSFLQETHSSIDTEKQCNDELIVDLRVNYISCISPS